RGLPGDSIPMRRATRGPFRHWARPVEAAGQATTLPTRFRAWPPDASQRGCQRLGQVRFLYSRQVTLVRVAGVQPNHIASAASLAVSRRKFPTPAPRGLPPQWPRHGPFKVSPERGRAVGPSAAIGLEGEAEMD